ncbi:hypothetical protein K2Z83_20665 [Oscillochloris sp. ZM17-4]|uniref:hypothetical protein n=1 Tax=Oscillochloris sp. ZM17-4 TaxID=2866714 RepID=UPI001C73590F|nr:hypothetical protein [Oscillochloris sp. ZM17-4]MBX0330084.1 hypothetical protein [Oscillochloris sp. ZM17-4]
MKTQSQPDPKGTITITYGELQCFASAVMAIARMAEQPGSGSAIGLFGCSTFLITCPAPALGVIGDHPEWNPILVNGQQVGNRYGAQKRYAHEFWTRRKAREEAEAQPPCAA